jgi:hypothetical protein
VIVVIAAAAVIVIACGLWGVARWQGWEPRWSRRLGHMLGESGFQAQATWAEFVDWIRFGR